MLDEALPMEPITHFMTGACLARAGCNRKAAYATLAMTLAAETPDLDILRSTIGPHAGPVAGFEHHRGITHTFVGLPFEALVVVGAVWLLHRGRLRRRRLSESIAATPVSAPTLDPTADQPIPHPLTIAPVRWGLLYGFVLLALLSHIVLDWTNNYGVRPFFPFNPRWYAGSIVFIFEPVLFAALLIGLTAPALFGLIGSEVGARRPAFRGRGWAIFALVAMLALWGWRQAEHDAAIRLASVATYGPADAPPPEVLRVTASPYPGNPYRWHIVAETPHFYQLATVDALRSTVSTDPSQDVFFKPPTTLATLVAKRTWLGEVYLDWSSWPLVTDIGAVGNFPVPLATPMAAPPGTTAVTFRDLRFLYDVPFLGGRRNPPISGAVYLDEDRRVVAMEMNGGPQK
jgi:inner membrane protein